MKYRFEMNKDIIIIGGGITGLTIAYYLKKAGKDFLLLEKQDRVGGVIKTNSENGFVFEEGPNTGVIGNADVVDLFDDLAEKCMLEVASANVNKRLVLKNGKWKPLPMGLWQAISTPLFTTYDKFRILGEPFRKAGNNPHETLDDMVRRRMGNSFLDYAVDPFILGVYAGDPSMLVPKYALPKLYNLEQDYGSFIKGSIKKGFKKKSEEEKKATRNVFSVEGGLSNLVNALTDSIGNENIITGVENIKVKKYNDKPDSVADLSAFDLKSSIKPDSVEDLSAFNKSENFIIKGLVHGKELTINAKKVITTTGAYTLSDMLPFINKSDIQKINSLHYTKVIEVAIGFRQWKGIPLDAFGGLIPHKEKRDILGAMFLSSLLSGRAPEKGALVTVFIGGVRRQDLIGLNDNEIYNLVEREFRDLMQIPEFNPDLLKIIRHNYAIPQYSADSGERFATVQKLENQFPGLIIGGNLRNGIGMADRIKQGKNLANSLM
ncbi:MAG: protoporphyrinogen oxidase [Bacteroidota bacterium]|nr:protoporphyrinogen oxidase [Bacteroidota bacterium]